MGTLLDFQKEALTVRIISYLYKDTLFEEGYRVCEKLEILTNKYRMRQNYSCINDENQV